MFDRTGLLRTAMVLVGAMAGCAFEIADDKPQTTEHGSPTDVTPPTDLPPVDMRDAGSRLATPTATFQAPIGRVCDPDGAFGNPNRVELPVPDGEHDIGFQLSPDELSGTLVRFVETAQGTAIDAYVARRNSLTSPFSELKLLGLPTWLHVQNTDERYGLTLTGDRLRAYHSITAPGGVPQMVTSSRSTDHEPFGAPVVESDLNLPGVNAGDPFVREDGRVVYFVRDDRAFRGIYLGAHHYAVEEVPELNPEPSGFHNLGGLVITPDDLVVYWWSVNKSEGRANMKMARRKSLGEPFGAARVLDELDLGRAGYPTYATEDNCTLYFNGGMSFEMYVAHRTPL